MRAKRHLLPGLRQVRRVRKQGGQTRGGGQGQIKPAFVRQALPGQRVFRRQAQLPAGSGGDLSPRKRRTLELEDSFAVARPQGHHSVVEHQREAGGAHEDLPGHGPACLQESARGRQIRRRCFEKIPRLVAALPAREARRLRHGPCGGDRENLRVHRGGAGRGAVGVGAGVDERLQGAAGRAKHVQGLEEGGVGVEEVVQG